MRCDNCFAFVNAPYEEEGCSLDFEGECFKDGSDGCRRSAKVIQKALEDLKIQKQKDEEIIVKQMGEQAKFYEEYWK